jgi:toxin ParE1/3/4
MANYKLSEEAKEDLIRIHHYGVEQFGENKAERYFGAFFDYFELISKNPFSFESVEYIRKGYRRCPCGSDTIYYKMNEGIVEIMAIVGNQELDKKL